MKYLKGGRQVSLMLAGMLLVAAAYYLLVVRPNQKQQASFDRCAQLYTVYDVSDGPSAQMCEFPPIDCGMVLGDPCEPAQVYSVRNVWLP